MVHWCEASVILSFQSFLLKTLLKFFYLLASSSLKCFEIIKVPAYLKIKKQTYLQCKNEDRFRCMEQASKGLLKNGKENVEIKEMADVGHEHPRQGEGRQMAPCRASLSYDALADRLYFPFSSWGSFLMSAREERRELAQTRGDKKRHRVTSTWSIQSAWNVRLRACNLFTRGTSFGDNIYWGSWNVL